MTRERRYDDPDVTVLDLLDLERIEQDLFRAGLTFEEQPNELTGRMTALYGGQVAAQALLAAGRTVAQDRLPHSLHGYFLRAGDSRVPNVFRVFRDRDGRSYSARRVVAIQHGEVIFNMSASFVGDAPGAVEQQDPMPAVAPADKCPEQDMFRLFSMEHRLPEPPYPRALWPTRFWSRSTVALPADPLVHACVLTYLSDVSTGILPATDGSALPSSSLDHAVWFHDRAELDDWVLSDFQPRLTGKGRGWYTGSVFAADGRLVASITQEALFR